VSKERNSKVLLKNRRDAPALSPRALRRGVRAAGSMEVRALRNAARGSKGAARGRAALHPSPIRAVGELAI
jgi:hypothetical protein